MLLINEIPFCLDPELKSGLNVALGPNSFDKFSKTPAAACMELDSAVDEAVAAIVVAEPLGPVAVSLGSFLTADDEVVDNINGDVILLNPGAN